MIVAYKKVCGSLRSMQFATSLFTIALTGSACTTRAPVGHRFTQAWQRMQRVASVISFTSTVTAPVGQTLSQVPLGVK